MRSALVAAARTRAGRGRSSSLSTVPPAPNTDEYVPELAAAAAAILYRSPLPSNEGRQVYILNAAAFPDAYEVDFDSLLAYVLARLPGEDELIAGTEYEIVFFAGGQPDSATNGEKKGGPSTGWYLQAYHVLSRATRKKLQRLYIVHPRTWVRVLVNIFSTIVSPKFRRKIVHVNSLTALAQHLPLEKLLIPPSAFLQDRKISPDIDLTTESGTRAFGTKHPLPKNITTGKTRLPRVLRETTSFLLLPSNIVVEGLFRIPPHSVLSGVLKEAYDRGQQFIVWKELHATFASPGTPPALVDEIRLEDAYGVHLAASLIKAWYRDLRQPIFPESSYSYLRERFQNPQDPVTPEQLVDLLWLESTVSPLTPTAREILNRHLLPMLAAIAAHEKDNKMTPENLAICFSMCLICGSNQLEDGRMTAVVKRVVQAAIQAWPQLMTGMRLDPNAFSADLEAPRDYRDYEDPLEEEPSYAITSKHAPASSAEGHRILMTDDEPASEPSADDRRAAPALPPRRPQATTPPRENPTPNVDGLTHVDPLPILPKRKPAPQVPASAPVAESRPPPPPPRYSSVFDDDGHSIHHADSPITLTPADGFGPPRSEFGSLHKKKYPAEKESSGAVPQTSEAPLPAQTPTPVSAVPAATMVVPKRKAVSGLHKAEDVNGSATPSPPATANPATLLANIITRKTSTPEVMIHDADANSTLRSSPTEMTPATAGDGHVFRKPSWPASAMHGTTTHSNSVPQPTAFTMQAPAQIYSLTKPVHAHTMPLLSSPDSLNPTATVPRHRAPSPGLLKRMASIETLHAQQQQQQSPQLGSATFPRSLPSPTSIPATPGMPTGPATPAQRRASEALLAAPRRLALRQTSVEDLRRIYEERASTVGSLASVAAAEAVRRGSAVT